MPVWLRHRYLVALIGVAVVLLLLRIVGSPPPEAPRRLHWVALAELRVALPAAADRGGIAARFPPEVAAAGLVPVWLELRNDGTEAVRIRPERSFLIDRERRAWPLLTAFTARQRLAAVTALESEAEARIDRASIESALPALTGFALSVRVQAAAGPRWNDWRRPFATLFGGKTEPLESSTLKDLGAGLLQNPPIPPGEAAEAYLFFPREAAAAGCRALRLSVARARSTQTLDLIWPDQAPGP